MNDNFNLVAMVDKLLLPGVVAGQTKKNISLCNEQQIMKTWFLVFLLFQN